MRRFAVSGSIENTGAFGKDLYAEVRRRGLSRANLQIVLGDGALWIWELANEHFPHVVQIIDLDHAREYLWEVGRSFPPNPSVPGPGWDCLSRMVSSNSIMERSTLKAMKVKEPRFASPFQSKEKKRFRRPLSSM